MGSKVKRDRMHRLQKGRCVYCLRKTVIPESGVRLLQWKPDLATLEHIIPQVVLERDDWWGHQKLAINEVLACHECNHNKGDLPLKAFLKVHTNVDINVIRKRVKKISTLLDIYLKEYYDSV